MKKIHTVGVFGVGVRGCHSLERELLATGRCRIKRVCHRPEFGARQELDPRAYAESFGAELTGDPDVLLADPEIDIISAMISPRAKNEWLPRVLAAGKSFVTDKPLCLDRAAAEKTLAAERQSGAVGCILAGYHTRPAVAELIRQLRSGAMGELKAFNLRLNFSGGIYPGFVPSKEWAADISGGESVTIGSHAVVTALKLADSPIAASRRIVKNDFFGSYREVGVDDYAIFNLRFANGVVANLSVARLPYRIAGEDILLEATAERGYARIAGTELTLYPGETVFDGGFSGADVLKATFNRFLDALEDRSIRPFVSVVDGVRMFDAFSINGREEK